MRQPRRGPVVARLAFAGKAGGDARIDMDCDIGMAGECFLDLRHRFRRDLRILLGKMQNERAVYPRKLGEMPKP